MKGLVEWVKFGRYRFPKDNIKNYRADRVYGNGGWQDGITIILEGNKEANKTYATVRKRDQALEKLDEYFNIKDIGEEDE